MEFIVTVRLTVSANEEKDEVDGHEGTDTVNSAVTADAVPHYFVPIFASHYLKHGDDRLGKRIEIRPRPGILFQRVELTTVQLQIPAFKLESFNKLGRGEN